MEEVQKCCYDYFYNCFEKIFLYYGNKIAKRINNYIVYNFIFLKFNNITTLTTCHLYLLHINYKVYIYLQKKKQQI